MRLTALVSCLLVASVAGCGGGGADLPADYRPVDVPPRTTDYVPPSPRPPTGLAGSTSPEEAARFDAEQLLLPQVRLPVQAQLVCPGPLRAGGSSRTVSCQVPYRGLQVPFEVTVAGGGSPFYTVEVRQTKGLFLAAAVRDAWAVEMRQNGEPLSCDAGMPEATLVPLDEVTPHRCAVGTSVYQVRIEIQGETSRIAFDPVR